MIKRAYILGAGFSRLAGFPFVKDLLEFVLKQLEKSKDIRDTGDSGFYKKLAPFIKRIRTHYPWLIENIELLFTYIDLACLHGNLGVFKECFPDFPDLRIFRMRLSGALYRAFRYKHDYSNTKEIVKNNSNANQIYWKFCDNLNEKDTIITFNYDLIVEKGLWLQNKWTFLDGYGFLKDIKSFIINSDKEYPSGKLKKSKIKILKLHGSLGWFYDESKEEVVLGEMNDSFNDYCGAYYENERSDVCVKYDEGTTFIEPSFVKKFSRPIILEIWAQAFREIMKANELIIIGYSLPEADSAARSFLSTSVHSSNLSSIKVVNPSSEIQSKIENFLRRKTSREIYKFEEWVENNM